MVVYALLWVKLLATRRVLRHYFSLEFHKLFLNLPSSLCSTLRINDSILSNLSIILMWKEDSFSITLSFSSLVGMSSNLSLIEASLTFWNFSSRSLTSLSTIRLKPENYDLTINDDNNNNNNSNDNINNANSNVGDDNDDYIDVRQILS